jgi:hypothetical protein
LLADRLRELESVFERLAQAPGDRRVRQQAVADALAVARTPGAADASDPTSSPRSSCSPSSPGTF